MPPDKKPDASNDEYQLTKAELAAVRRVADRIEKAPPLPPFKITRKEDGYDISVNHPEPGCGYALMADRFGIGSITVTSGIIQQSSMATGKVGPAAEKDLNFQLAVIAGIAPRDTTELLLATQMATVHVHTMIAARRLAQVETIDQQNSASNMINKLTRTFAAQMDALKRYRATGEQTVTVHHQHVNVGDGGQAIVGANVLAGGGAPHKNGGQPHEPSGTCQSGPPLLSHEQADRMPLPGAGNAGQAGVPVPRGARRGAQGQG